MTILYIALGGAVGAVLRYLAVTGVHRLAAGPLPWGTLAVNVAGSFALGFLLLASERWELSLEVRRFAAVGLLGAFTTFSAFSFEIAVYLRDQRWLAAGSYAAMSVGLGVSALMAGGALASSLRAAADA